MIVYEGQQLEGPKLPNIAGVYLKIYTDWTQQVFTLIGHRCMQKT